MKKKPHTRPARARPLFYGTVVLATAAVSACAEGQLQQATVNRACADGPNCSITPFPRPLAVGAATLSPIDLASAAGSPALVLRAADEGVVQVNGPLLEGVGTGTTAILIENEDGVVLDFIHLSVAEATLALLQPLAGPAALPDRIEVAPGSTVTLLAKIYGGAAELLGDADESFVADNPAFTLHVDTQRQVTVTAPNTIESTLLSYTSLGLAASMTIAVVTP
jgi:hypothetical protein